jgi:hypothetical protein
MPLAPCLLDASLRHAVFAVPYIHQCIFRGSKCNVYNVLLAARSQYSQRTCSLSSFPVSKRLRSPKTSGCRACRSRKVVALIGNTRAKSCDLAFVRRGLLQSPEIGGVGRSRIAMQRALKTLGTLGKTFSSSMWLQYSSINLTNRHKIHRVLRRARWAKTGVF